MAGEREKALGLARRSLLALRLEVAKGIADEVTKNVEAAFTALALPPDPAPGIEEVERLVDAARDAEFALGCDESFEGTQYARPDAEVKRDRADSASARAALLAAIRALAAPGADRYAEGWRAGVLSAREFLRRTWDDGEQGNGNDAAELELLRLYAGGAIPAPAAPTGEREGQLETAIREVHADLLMLAQQCGADGRDALHMRMLDIADDLEGSLWTAPTAPPPAAEPAPSQPEATACPAGTPGCKGEKWNQNNDGTCDFCDRAPAAGAVRGDEGRGEG